MINGRRAPLGIVYNGKQFYECQARGLCRLLVNATTVAQRSLERDVEDSSALGDSGGGRADRRGDSRVLDTPVFVEGD